MQFLISEYEFLLEPYVTRSWRARGLAQSKSYHVSTPIGLRFLCSRTHTTTGMLFWNFNVHFPLVPRKQLFGFTPLSPPTSTSSNPCQDCLLHIQCDLNINEQDQVLILHLEICFYIFNSIESGKT